MESIVIEKPEKINLRETKMPIPQKGFARIKVEAAAICATDLEVIDGNIPANYPCLGQLRKRKSNEHQN
jgi:L-iditol 2-dehydrogenase